jgi:hypothetical protein
MIGGDSIAFAAFRNEVPHKVFVCVHAECHFRATQQFDVIKLTCIVAIIVVLLHLNKHFVAMWAPATWARREEFCNSKFYS